MSRRPAGSAAPGPRTSRTAARSQANARAPCRRSPITLAFGFLFSALIPHLRRAALRFERVEPVLGVRAAGNRVAELRRAALVGPLGRSALLLRLGRDALLIRSASWLGVSLPLRLRSLATAPAPRPLLLAPRPAERLL